MSDDKPSWRDAKPPPPFSAALPPNEYNAQCCFCTATNPIEAERCCACARRNWRRP